MMKAVCEKLVSRGITISACESCTGGLFASRLTDMPGVSAVFDRSLVTYSYRAKMEELGVKEETLRIYTAESYEVAEEMVLGLKEKTGSDVCVSVTGLAGPGGGTDDNPVGTIYIACAYEDKVDVKKLQTGSADRSYNREYAVNEMFRLIDRMIG
ncbi:MAG: CinA family protein [Firmicutes bacterium]|nr:CinA family protein [Bacillota bacterium]